MIGACKNMGRYEKLTDKQLKLVEDNIKLVKFTISKYINVGVDEYDDLYQVGCIALMHAAENFKEDKGIAFSTYAVQIITGEIKTYKNTHGVALRTLRVPSGLRSLVSKVRHLKGENIDLSVEDMSKILGVDESLVKEAIISIGSLSDKAMDIKNKVDGDEISLLDTLPSKSNTELEAISTHYADWLLEQLRGRLTERGNSILNDILEGYIAGRVIVQRELAVKYGVGQTIISREYRIIRAELQKIIDESAGNMDEMAENNNKPKRRGRGRGRPKKGE